MDLPKRKTTRLKGWDYSSQSYYFVTICTHSKAPLFSCVGNGLDRSEIELNWAGRIAAEAIVNIPGHFQGVRVDKYVVMPNHIHAVVVIGCDGETERSRPFLTLSTVIGLYKSGVSKRIHETDSGTNVWQRSFHDHIIRSEAEYCEIWQYIDTNPQKWREDCFFTE